MKDPREMSPNELREIVADHSGWSQVGVARSIGLSDSQLRKYVNRGGDRTTIPSTVALAIRWLVQNPKHYKQLGE
jgi:hypothetical protein